MVTVICIQTPEIRPTAVANALVSQSVLIRGVASLQG